MSGPGYDIVIVGVILLLFGLDSIKRGNINLLGSLRSGNSISIYFEKLIAGIFLFGIVPFFLANIRVDYIQLPEPTTSQTGIFILISFFVIGLSLYSGLRQAPVEVYRPALQLVVYFYLPLRILYLVAYEFFFRGYFLFTTVALWNVETAIVLNIAAYSLVHSVNGRNEFIGSIPFGFVLCLFTVSSGSIWPAVLLHLLLALPFEVCIIRKSIHLIKQTRQ